MFGLLGPEYGDPVWFEAQYVPYTVATQGGWSGHVEEKTILKNGRVLVWCLVNRKTATIQP